MDENVFVWTAAGVRRISRRIRETFSSRPPRASLMSPRRYPRLDLKLPILYKPLGEEASSLPEAVRPFLLAESANVSSMGACLKLSERLEPGAALSLAIHMPDGREKFSAVGRVVWVKPAPEAGDFLTGVEFVLVQGDRLVEARGRFEGLVAEAESPPG